MCVCVCVCVRCGSVEVLIPAQKIVDQPVLFLKVKLYDTAHTQNTHGDATVPLSPPHIESRGLCSSILLEVAMETENGVCMCVCLSLGETCVS